MAIASGRAPGARIRACAALYLFLTACERKSNAYAPPPAAGVTVGHPIRGIVTRYMEATGTTEAFDSVELRARVPGFLDTVAYKPGAAVKRGDLLFVIDRRTYQATVERADGFRCTRFSLTMKRRW